MSSVPESNSEGPTSSKERERRRRAAAASPQAQTSSTSGSPPALDHIGYSDAALEFDSKLLGMDADAAMDMYWSTAGASLETHGSNSWTDDATDLSYMQADASRFGGMAEAMQYPMPVAPPERSPSLFSFPTLNGGAGMLQNESTLQTPSSALSCSSGAATATTIAAEGDLAFDSSMQLCRELQEYCHYASQRPSSVHHTIFHHLPRLCTAAMNVPPTAGHCPTAALALAAMLKVLELCSLIIAKLPGSPGDSSSMGAAHLQDMFVMKMVLRVIKLFLADKGHQAGVQKAQELEATVLGEYPELAWGDVDVDGQARYGELPYLTCATAR